MPDPDAVREMFSSISPRYDLLNRLLSAGRDRAWRRKAVEGLDLRAGDLVLDLCGGTGDLSLEAARRGARVVCCDFSFEMLARAEVKFRSGAEASMPVREITRDGGPARPGGGDGLRGPGTVPTPSPESDARGSAAEPASLLADALRLPFPDGTFRAVTIGFGLRNLRTLDEGLDEILRVLTPGGRGCILEFSHPTAWPIAGLYRLYLNRILPRVGDWISRREGPYGYLARTIGEFPEGDELAARMTARGFTAVTWQPLTGGIVALHVGARAG